MRHAVLLLSLGALGCGGASTAPARGEAEPVSLPDGPYVLVLGSAQDAGIPQLGSRSPGSERARRDPSFRRLAASLLLADPRRGERWLFDATPDLREQLERARQHPPGRTTPEGRPPPFDAIFLTHAHMGHYTGLMQLGREAYAAEGQPVRCSARMCEHLRSNAPWELLVRAEHVVIEPFAADEPIRLADDLEVTPIEVPHRGEYTDTFGFVIRGPSRALLYIPDIDKWEDWDRDVESVIAGVDYALLDGTFAVDGEVGGRPMAEIPHPFLEESLARFGALPAAERAKITFTHLNHTNEAADPDSAMAARVRDAGMAIAREMEVFAL